MNSSFKRIIVTGGCGFVGTALVPLLSEKGYHVVVADDMSNPQSQVREGYEFLHIDVGDLNAVRKAFQDADACIALASRRGAIGYVHRNPTDIMTGNHRIYNGTFSAAAEAGIQRLVFISSSMVFENSFSFPTRESDLPTLPAPKSIFGFSKLSGEWYCQAFWREFGLPYTIIRPSNVYGINEVAGDEVGDTHVIPELFKKMASGQHPVELLGDGQQTRSFIHSTDLARGVIAALESDDAVNEEFNMGGMEEIRILDLAKLIWDLCGMNGKFQATYKPGFHNDVTRQFLDISKARKLLGWHPQVSLEVGLKEVVEWLREQSSERVDFT